MIGGHPDMGSALLQHFQYAVEYTRDCAERPVYFRKSAQTVEVAKQFVRAVDEMNDHSRHYMSTVRYRTD